jgi:hypothetical protein
MQVVPQLYAQTREFLWVRETNYLVRLRFLHVPLLPRYRVLTLVIILVTRTDKLATLIISQLFENLTIIMHRFFSQPLVIVRILPTAGYQL